MAFREPIHFLGAGSIGMCFAAWTRSKIPTYPLNLLVRDHHLQRVKDGCLSISFQQLANHQTTELIKLPVQSITDDDPIQNLIITTKAYQAKQAVESVLGRMNESSRIIVLCNGALSVRDDLSKLLQGHYIPLILATTTHGVYKRKDKYEVVHAGIGNTFVEESADDIGALWNSVGLYCQSVSSEDMQTVLWKKLAANCVINPLTALLQCTNGELLMEPSFPQLQHEIIQEIVQVSSNQDDIDEESLTKFVYQVIRDTSDNKSSMYQDTLHRQETEIDHLNGYIVRKGREFDIDCSTNEDLCLRIKQLTKAKI